MFLLFCITQTNARVLTDKQTKCADNAQPPQPALSASALLREHEKTMKSVSDKTPEIMNAVSDKVPETVNAVSDNKRETTNAVSEKKPETMKDVSDKKHRQVTSSDVDVGAGPAASVRSGCEVRQADSSCHDIVSSSHKRHHCDTLKNIVKSQDTVPQLGRGLTVNCSGFVDLDDIDASPTVSAVTADSATADTLKVS